MMIWMPENQWVIAVMLAVGIATIILYVYLAIRKERKLLKKKGDKDDVGT